MFKIKYANTYPERDKFYNYLFLLLFWRYLFRISEFQIHFEKSSFEFIIQI